MSRRILIVDDDPHIREVAATTLGLLGGWEVLTADGGGVAVAIAAAQRPDAILLDLMMPDLDGPATLALLRAEPATAHIPVILLTAGADRGRERFDGQELAAVIAKPFDPLLLPAQVADALGWPE